MPRRKSEQMTPLELEIMQVLWETGPANCQTVQRQLKRELAYTTVQTMLNVLWRKQKVRRTLVERAFWYKPAVTRQRAVGIALNDVVKRFFGGSAEALVVALMETKQLTPETLRKLQRLVDEDYGRE